MEAERAALRGGVEPAADAVAAGRLLWLGPTLLLCSRATYDDDVLAPPVTEVATKGVERANMVRVRLQMAESGQWEALLRAYLADTAAADSADRSRYDRSTTRSLPVQPLTGAEVFTKAATKAAGHALKSASDLLLGATHTALTEKTARAVDFLVAEEVPDDEAQALRREVDLARAAVPTDLRVRHRHYRRRLRVAKLAAQPGPSGWRNSHLVAVAAVQGGVAAMARWGELWQRCQLAPGTVRLWTAACVSPVDCGERPLEPHERPDAPRKRRLRPIACAECPLKLVEGAAIDAVMTEVAPALEPAQMGCGAADGAGVMVSLLRTWAGEEMVAHAELPQGPLVFAGLDLENAYGRAYRSACVRGLRRRAPTLAPLAATQWSCAAVTAWQRADGAWRSSETTRGGWQGSRLTQLSFCCGLEEGLDAAVLFAHSDAAVDGGACGPVDAGRGGGGGGCTGGGDAEHDGGTGDAEHDGGTGDAEYDADLGDAGAGGGP